LTVVPRSAFARGKLASHGPWSDNARFVGSPSKASPVCSSFYAVTSVESSSPVVHLIFGDILVDRRTALVESILYAVLPIKLGLSPEVFRSPSWPTLVQAPPTTGLP
jgi:hypothetical protein